VIYVGNFSKNIVPSLRIGYMVLPAAIVDVFKRVRSSLSRQPPGIDQAVLAEFIADGHLDRHVRVTLRTYREREQVLRDAITREGRGLIEAAPSGTGTYLVAWLREGIDDRVAATDAATAGVDAIPLSTFALQSLPRHGLVLGYSAYDERRIRGAVRQLCSALSRVARTE
jgi:GntR family transcriptional regulator/MocR family aminotransferase